MSKMQNIEHSEGSKFFESGMPFSRANRLSIFSSAGTREHGSDTASKYCYSVIETGNWKEQEVKEKQKITA